MRVDWTAHALHRAKEQNIDPIWVARALAAPERLEQDRTDPEIMLYFQAVPEAGDRVLRIAAVPVTGGFRVITVFFDRGELRRRRRT